MDSFVELQFSESDFERVPTYFAMSVGCVTGGFHWDCELIFQATIELESRVWWWQVKCQKLAHFTDIRQYFLIKYSSDCCKPLVSFQSSDKFLPAAYCFNGGENSLSSYIIIFTHFIFKNFFMIINIFGLSNIGVNMKKLKWHAGTFYG